MASDIVIRAEHLGKKYIIGHQAERESYAALRDVIARSARNWARSVRDMATGAANVAGDELEEFWALRDVNFEIRRGDVVGVIGRNGAGKSTLLKVLSRITEPSKGRVEIRGRVASLLEVGTGFHPELTGRENIYLNGAILGMSRAEIKQKFDEIVAFAEIDKFLDTPVKRYSSGMYVRLAFAVAAHLEPEILIVDEVLAVGDAEFQKKCLGKIKDVASHGRTVLFVSHNMAAVRQLCSSGVLLAAGEIRYAGSSAEAIGAYLGAGEEATNQYSRAHPSKERPNIVDASISSLLWNERRKRLELAVILQISAPKPKHACIDFRIKDQTGVPVGFATSGALDSAETIPLAQGKTSVLAILDLTAFAVGSYTLSIDINVPWAAFDDRLDDALRFEIGSQHWRSSINPLRQDYSLGSLLIDSSISPLDRSA